MADESLDVGVAEKAESRHSRPAERVAAVLDDVEEVPLGAAGRPHVRQIPRPQQEEGRPPRATAVHAVAGHAVGVVEALAPAGTGGRVGGVEEPGQPAGHHPDGEQGRHEADQGPAHDG